MILHFTKVFFLITALLSHLHYIEGQQNQVSPKLDFDGTEDTTSNNNNNKTNSTTGPVVPGGVRGRTDGDRDRDREHERDRDRDVDGVGGGSGGATKSGPKIHGVRVTVDTGDTHKSKESKESVEITDVGKHKKRVGIHTDITFEITADGEVVDGNGTSSAQKEDKEDASVPIFKGRDRSSQKPRKPYDPKARWNPNFSSERRGYDSSGTGRGSSGSAYGGYPYYPEYRPHNVPVYTSESRHSGGSSVYYRDDGWSSYRPHGQTQWTTERSYYDQPYQSNSVPPTSWKPCYCLDSGREQRRRRHSTASRVGFNIFTPTSSVLQVVDGKLERPFSRK